MKPLYIPLMFALLGTAQPASLADHIDRLRTNDASSQLALIDKYGCSALPHLIQRIKVLSPGHYSADGLNEEVQQQVYIIAALRYITGRDFYGKISRFELSKYDEPARQFLTDGAPVGQVKFFGWWPSHGSFYIAPRTAQQEIINGWKSYADSGSCKQSTWRGRSQSNFYLSGNRKFR